MDLDSQIDTILNRGVETVVDRDVLYKKLKSGKKLRIKFGIDPTSSDVHLGRTIPLLKLRDFQEMGHHVILLIGNFTALIGDVSDKDSERPMLEAKQVEENLLTYIEQISKVIDMEKVEVVKNADWLSKLSYIDIARQATNFSVNEFCSRDVIRRRMDAGKRVSLRELLYPLMQGYDSVELKADVEIGGLDQTFNLLTGRDMQRQYGQEPQDILTGPIIDGLDGNKMSSSKGNVIRIFDAPDDMFGKVMSIKDSLIIQYFTLLTRVDLQQIEGYKKSMETGENPRETKLKLAEEIVRMYYAQDIAVKAKENFQNVFSNKETPKDLPMLKPKNYNIISILLEAGFVQSSAEAKRVLQQGGVQVNGSKESSADTEVCVNSVVRKGKLSFVKII